MTQKEIDKLKALNNYVYISLCEIHNCLYDLRVRLNSLEDFVVQSKVVIKDMTDLQETILNLNKEK